MIILDTHIWIWWIHAHEALSSEDVEAINALSLQEALGISAISCWEVAKLVERGRLFLPLDVGAWMSTALAYPGVQLIPLSPAIAVASTMLPGAFHRDPADQIIVASARTLGVPILTRDHKIVRYPHVEKHMLSTGRNA